MRPVSVGVSAGSFFGGVIVVALLGNCGNVSGVFWCLLQVILTGDKLEQRGGPVVL